MEITKLKKMYENFPEKVYIDFSFWLDFEHDYHINELGGLRFLREVLGDPDKFIEKYKK